ncbi:MAG: hypothetical protein ACLSUW_09605, partial [Akkermansia sp.]
LMEDRLLVIDSGSFFDGNMAGGEANDIFAEDGAAIVVNTDADATTVINSGISDADYFTLDDDPEWVRGSASLVQLGGGNLLYGGRDQEDNGFGGDFLQYSGAGSLIVGHVAEIDNELVVEGAQLGVEDLDGNQRQRIILMDNSPLVGDTLNQRECRGGSGAPPAAQRHHVQRQFLRFHTGRSGNGRDLTHTASGISSGTTWPLPADAAGCPCSTPPSLHNGRRQ